MAKLKGFTLISFVITIAVVSLACIAFHSTRWVVIAYLAIVIYFYPMLLVTFLLLVALYLLFMEEFK